MRQGVLFIFFLCPDHALRVSIYGEAGKSSTLLMSNVIEDLADHIVEGGEHGKVWEFEDF